MRTFTRISLTIRNGNAGISVTGIGVSGGEVATIVGTDITVVTASTVGDEVAGTAFCVGNDTNVLCACSACTGRWSSHPKNAIGKSMAPAATTSNHRTGITPVDETLDASTLIADFSQ
jgi:hypothetical protein